MKTLGITLAASAALVLSAAVAWGQEQAFGRSATPGLTHAASLAPREPPADLSGMRLNGLSHPMGRGIAPRITAGREAPSASRSSGLRAGIGTAPLRPGATAGMARIGGGPGLAGLAPAPVVRTPIGGLPGDISARDVGTWAGPNGIGLTLGDVSGPLAAIGSPPGMVAQGQPPLRPGISVGGSRAGTPAAWAVGGIGMAAGVPQPNFVGRGINMNIQPGPNTAIGEGLASDYGVYGGRAIASGGGVGAGYGANARTRWYLDNYGVPFTASRFGDSIHY